MLLQAGAWRKNLGVVECSYPPPMPPDSLESLTIAPPAFAGDLLSPAWSHFFTRVGDRERRFREQLGLPVDRAIIMSGHQLAFWHPGILAKWLAVAELLSPGRAGPRVAGAWVWVDQDANAFGDVRYAVWGAEDVVEARIWRCTPFLSGVAPICGMRPFEPSPPPEEGVEGVQFATAEMRPGLGAIHAALAEAGSESDSAAEQVRRALVELLKPLTSGPSPQSVFATALSRTDLFTELVERMRRAPRECTDAYNAAVAAFPGGHADEVMMLSTGAGQLRGAELPLWHVPPAPTGPHGSPGTSPPRRRRVQAADLDVIPAEQLAPRGLMMTGLLRLAGCDMFIHGTGGGGPLGYDRITEMWFRRWLGAELAPTAVVTADVMLEIPPPPGQAEHTIPSPEEVAAARWRAHHARHEPALLADPAAAGQKWELVQRIARLPRHDPERGVLFRRMHQLLERVRREQAAGLRELDRTAELATARLGSAPLLRGRSWAFPLYPAEALEELRRAVAARSEAGGHR